MMENRTKITVREIFGHGSNLILLFHILLSSRYKPFLRQYVIRMRVYL